eukprot:scaffold142193_cov27-Tisochrysis_lutea.AAC.2
MTTTERWKGAGRITIPTATIRGLGYPFLSIHRRRKASKCEHAETSTGPLRARPWRVPCARTRGGNLIKNAMVAILLSVIA